MQSVCDFAAPGAPAASSAASIISAFRSASLTAGSSLLPSAPAILLDGPQTPTASTNASSIPVLVRAKLMPVAPITTHVENTATANRFIVTFLPFLRCGSGSTAPGPMFEIGLSVRSRACRSPAQCGHEVAQGTGLDENG